MSLIKRLRQAANVEGQSQWGVDLFNESADELERYESLFESLAAESDAFIAEVRQQDQRIELLERLGHDVVRSATDLDMGDFYKVPFHRVEALDREINWSEEALSEDN